jgi:hypothetical protein
MQNIKWVTVEGFSRYEVSNTGVIRSMNYKNSGRVVDLSPCTDKKGYLKTVLLADTGKYVNVTVHRVVISNFKEKVEGKDYINHIDGVKSNNHIDNLEWCTISENMLHAYANGLMIKKVGSSNGNSKLKEHQVKAIRESAAAGGRYYGRKDLALKYGVSECTIKEVVTRRKNKFYNVK